MRNYNSDLQKNSRIPWRGIIVALLLIPLNNYWVLRQEALWYARPTYGVPYYNVVIILLFCVFLNAVVKRTPIRRYALAPSELVVIYILLSVASSFACHQALGELIPLMAFPSWFATPENEYQQVIQPHLPEWLTVSDKTALAPFYNGESSLLVKEHLAAWLPPLLYWALFTLVLFLSMICLLGILRKQWTDHERLTYPITEIPIQITQPRYLLFRNRLFWLGFSIAGFIALLSGLHFLFPSVPHINVRRHDFLRFTNRPFSYMGTLRVSYNPFLIGTCYFMPVDLSFSLWFFYLLGKLQHLVSGMMGWRRAGVPYLPEQSAGAFVAIFLGTIWVTRAHLREVFRSAIGKGKLSSADEPLPYSFAFFGFLGCVTFLVIFSIQAGASPLAIIGFFFFYYAITVAISKLRAQIGFPLHGLELFTPASLIVMIAGSNRISRGTMGVSTLYNWFSWEAFSSHPMPHQLEGYHIAHRLGKEKRRLTIALIFALMVTVFTSFLILLDLYYKEGGDSGKFNWTSQMYGNYAYSQMKSWITQPSSPDLGRIGGMAFGAIFGFLLMAMRRRFIFWPFHILGYSMSGTWAIPEFWSVAFISFIIKFSILRFRGLKGYRQAVPFFMGLIVGEISVGSFWSILGFLSDHRMYDFFPGHWT
ncbi:DUF6785 family protein [Candidatus Poribacteria bacterium]